MLGGGAPIIKEGPTLLHEISKGGRGLGCGV